MISIVTPSFRQLEWLRLAVASVADQTGVEFEHIVQDAESGFDLSELPQHEKLRLFVEADGGMYDAINRGLKRTHGEICCYLNCDEQYLPGALQEVASYFAAHPDIDIVFADAILLDAEGRPLSYRRVTLPALSHLRLAHLNTLTCATFFRRRLLAEGHFFPTHLKIAGDHAWVFRLLQSGVRMDVLHRPLSVFTFTGTNLSHSAGAEAERYGWLPPGEKPNRWWTPFAIAWHRLRKLRAGAYRKREVAIDIYTRGQPSARRRISARIGFRWPKDGNV